MPLANRFFISCVSAEFRTYRSELHKHLTSATQEVKIQEDFAPGGYTLLEKLNQYIAQASGVLHLVGKSTGAKPQPAEVQAILDQCDHFSDALPTLASDLDPATCPFSYTQWEAFLAKYHRVPCFVYLADNDSVREPGWTENSVEAGEQEAHRARLVALGHYRTTVGFADARDVALAFYKGYLDEITGHSGTGDSVPVAQWPKVPPLQEGSLADRQADVARFCDLIGGVSKERILMLYGPSDRGKSRLLAEFDRIAADCTPLHCARAEFKNSPNLSEVLFNIAEELRPAIRFPRFERELERNAPEMLRVSFLRDLGEASQAVVLILDAFEHATEEATRWVEQQLLPLVARRDGIRLVIAGQRVPAAGAGAVWADTVICYELPMIKDPEHWDRYVKQMGVKNLPGDHLVTLVKATGGSPRGMHDLLEKFQTG
ncbi:MAG TPA: ATP-binding protein [Thermoanaerobaculia bacterium]|nr:ATP-binding protein [Thermoanaerobaculia bacterium]